jgi:hypothetical protein
MLVVASPVEAEAPLASARDMPAIPNADKALVRRSFFRGRLDMAQFSNPLGRQVACRLITKLALIAVVPGRIFPLKREAEGSLRVESDKGRCQCCRERLPTSGAAAGTAICVV